MIKGLVRKGLLDQGDKGDARAGFTAPRIVALTEVEAKTLRFVKMKPGFTLEIIAFELRGATAAIRVALNSLVGKDLIFESGGRYAGSIEDFRAPMKIPPALAGIIRSPETVRAS
jgi:hypothetical protein